MSDIQIHNYDAADNRPGGEPTWDTEALQHDFTVEFFAAPFVLVIRKADGVKGSLRFKHSPRIYYGFEAD